MDKLMPQLSTVLVVKAATTLQTLQCENNVLLALNAIQNMQVHHQTKIALEITAYEAIPEVESNTCTAKEHEDELSKKGVDIGKHQGVRRERR